jgi:hypothetical protein
MKLHKILLRHAGPKDSVEVVFKYVLANSEQEILDEIDNPRGGYTYGAWQEDEELYDVYDVYDEVVGTETYLQRMLRLRGEFNDEDASYDDAYYGVKHWGWDEGVEISAEEADVLIAYGVAKDWRNDEGGE